jgi:hypothetical protein
MKFTYILGAFKKPVAEEAMMFAYYKLGTHMNNGMAIDPDSNDLKAPLSILFKKWLLEKKLRYDEEPAAENDDMAAAENLYMPEEANFHNDNDEVADSDDELLDSDSEDEDDLDRVFL